MHKLSKAKLRKNPHASLECPECGKLCVPRRELKGGGCLYRCGNADGHGDFLPMFFRIDDTGNVDWPAGR